MSTHDESYPTLTEVEAADHLTLCRWYRFLPSPGTAAIGTPDFEARLQREREVLNRIVERVTTEAAMTPAVSKQIGWDS